MNRQQLVAHFTDQDHDLYNQLTNTIHTTGARYLEFWWDEQTREQFNQLYSQVAQQLGGEIPDKT